MAKPVALVLTGALVGSLTTWLVARQDHRPDPAESVVQQYVAALDDGRFGDAMQLVVPDRRVDPALVTDLDAAPLGQVTELDVAEVYAGRQRATFRLGGRSYSVALEEQDGRLLLEKPEVLQEYTLDDRQDRLGGLEALGPYRLSTPAGLPVPVKGWTVEPRRDAGEQPVTVTLGDLDSPYARVTLPATVDPKHEAAFSVLPPGTPLPQVQKPVQGRMVYRTWYVQPGKGRVDQTFGINRISACTAHAPRSESEQGILLDCAWVAEPRDTTGKPLTLNSGPEVPDKVGTTTCSVEEPQERRDGPEAPTGTALVAIRNKKVEIVWQPARAHDPNSFDTTSDDPCCGLNRPKVGPRALLAGLVPAQEGATTITVVEATAGPLTAR